MFSVNFARISGNFWQHQSTAVSAVVANEALTFSRSGVRIFQTHPVNTSDVKYLQFHIRFDGFNSKLVRFLTSSQMLEHVCTFRFQRINLRSCAVKRK